MNKTATATLCLVIGLFAGFLIAWVGMINPYKTRDAELRTSLNRAEAQARDRGMAELGDTLSALRHELQPPQWFDSGD